MKKIFILILMTLLICSTENKAYCYIYKTAWVGEAFECEVKPFGTHYNVKWYTNSSCIRLTGGTNYRRIATITHYFEGTATITCTWEYQLYYGGPLTKRTTTWDIKCVDNPIQILPSNNISLNIGESYKLSYKLQYDNKYSSYANPKFYTSNPNILSVSDDGEVTALAKGQGYVYLHSDVSSNKHSPCIFTVTAIEPTSIKIPEKIKLKVGEEYKIVPEILPSNATTKLKWHSHTYHATVSEDGVVKAVKLGIGYITVKTDNNLSDTCNIQVTCDPDSLVISTYNKKHVLFVKDTSDRFYIVLKPSESSSKLTLLSLDENIATAQIDTSFWDKTYYVRIYAHNVGETYIECKTENGLSQKIYVQVKGYTMKDPMDGKKINKYFESDLYKNKSNLYRSYLK